MLTALLITLLPTLLAYLLLAKVHLLPKSISLKLSFSWFIGIFSFTLLTFGFALILQPFTTQVLMKATYSALLITNILLLLFAKRFQSIFISLKAKILSTKSFPATHLTFFILCFLFCYVFYIPHLATSNETIYTSVIYWDFHWHAAIIQNFVYGDNFPPQNEAFAGEAMTYHFFGDLVMAMYVAVGISLTDAVTGISILFLFMLFVTLIGLGEELFHTKWVGIIAVILTVTSSSGHFIYYLIEHSNQPFWQTLIGIFAEDSHPWSLSFIRGDPYGYNGTMFNLFYYLEERHMIIGFIYSLLCFWLITKRKNLSPLFLLIIGALMACFFFWHLYITVIIGIVIVFLLLFAQNRRQTLFLLVGFTSVFLLQYLSIKYIIETSVAFTPDTTSYPQFNYEFGVRNPDASFVEILIEMFRHYVFAYGLKLILVPTAIILLWRQQKQLALLFIAFIVPVFIVINTLQVSPTAIHENHKLLLPMTIICNIAAAYILYSLFFQKKRFILAVIGSVCLFLLTFSGVIEHMPFINAKPTELYADVSNKSMTSIIRKNTDSRDVLFGKDKREIHLAGRKLYVGQSAGPAPSINTKIREHIAASLYQASDIQSFCSITRNNNIDIVEFADTTSPLMRVLINLPHFRAVDAKGKEVLFIHAKQGCI